MRNMVYEGQVNFFDVFIDTTKIIENTPQEKMKSKTNVLGGDTVFCVVKGEVIEYMATGESWESSSNEVQIYQLQRKDCQLYSTLKETDIGVTAFFTKEEAEHTAEEYRKGKDIIYAADMQSVEIHAYSYIRECDGRKMTAFYADLGNGYLYIKEFYTFHHIVKKTPKCIKKFMEQQEFKSDRVEIRTENTSPLNMFIGGEKVFYPEFKNMYRCHDEQSEWIYAEAGYTKAIG